MLTVEFGAVTVMPGREEAFVAGREAVRSEAPDCEAPDRVSPRTALLPASSFRDDRSAEDRMGGQPGSGKSSLTDAATAYLSTSQVQLCRSWGDDLRDYQQLLAAPVMLEQADIRPGVRVLEVGSRRT